MLPPAPLRDGGAAAAIFHKGSAAAASDAGRRCSRYAGPWPRVSIWHGASDAVVHPNNARELVDQWTNVHGLDAAADATTTVNGATRARLKVVTMHVPTELPANGAPTVTPETAPLGSNVTVALV